LSFAQGGFDRSWSARALDQWHNELTNEQCFYLDKPAPDGIATDSRRPEGLAARLELRRCQRVPHPKGGDGVALEVQVQNIGKARWLDAIGPGQVNLGLQLLTPDGEMLNNNLGRVKLPAGPVDPGGEVRFEAVIKRPAVEGPWVLQIDMVSEYVAWFGLRGSSTPIRCTADQI
jgi:hypothetical protein